jgi:transcriptional regulator with PAS, ATPase and Fis domain
LESADVKKLLEKIQLYEGVLNNILSGVLITDPDGYIIFFSDTYGKFLGMDPKAQIGKHTTDVIENSRMHIVAKTGIPEINHPHQIMGRNQIVQRIPIFTDGKLSAVFGQVMFEDIKDVQILADKLNILESKVQLYEKELANLRASKYSCRNIVGESSVMQELRKMGQRAAKVNSPVLLVGESGTGKELFAHAIHRASERHKLPFIRLNCAAIPKDLLEAELFGYEPGAFTGAGNKGKPGKFDAAQAAARSRGEARRPPRGHKARQVRLPAHRGGQ